MLLDRPVSFPSINIPSMHLKINGLAKDWKNIGSLDWYTVPEYENINCINYVSIYQLE